MNQEKIAQAYRSILEGIGEDPQRRGLQATPQRTAKALAYLVKGYHEDVGKIINNALFSSQAEEIVLVQNIELFSLCEHHLLPFFGKCHVAYLPNGWVLGLSKIARIVDVYARRLQIQEELTAQIATKIMTVTQAKGVAVTIEARHLCMMMRGVEKQNSIMKTSSLLGAFRNSPATRAEYFSLLNEHH